MKQSVQGKITHFARFADRDIIQIYQFKMENFITNQHDIADSGYDIQHH